MNSVEFQATIQNGIIQIPEQYRTEFEQKAIVKVIVIKQPKHTARVENLIQHLLDHPLTLLDFQPLTRDEIYER